MREASAVGDLSLWRSVASAKTCWELRGIFGDPTPAAGVILGAHSSAALFAMGARNGSAQIPAPLVAEALALSYAEGNIRTLRTAG